MIDYEKIKMAHELAVQAVKCGPDLSLKTEIITRITTDEKIETYLHGELEDKRHYDYYREENLDVLIENLQKIIDRPESQKKYHVGQQVWMLSQGDISECLIEEIYCNTDLHDYKVFLVNENKISNVAEKDIHPCKESIIESQIEYWSSLRNEDKSTRAYDASKESKPCKKKIMFGNYFDYPEIIQRYNEKSILVKFWTHPNLPDRVEIVELGSPEERDAVLKEMVRHARGDVESSESE